MLALVCLSLSAQQYSDKHFDPGRMKVGQNWMPNSDFWSSQKEKIRRIIVADDSFSGGRAMEAIFPALNERQAFHCRLDPAPPDATGLEFELQLRSGTAPAYVEFTQKNSAGGENIFRFSLPDLPVGKTIRIRKDFASLKFSSSHGKAPKSDRSFLTGRITGMDFYFKRNQESAIRLGAIRFYRGKESVSSGRNLLPWDPDFETGPSGFLSVDMKQKVKTGDGGFHSRRSLDVVSPTTSSLIPEVIRSDREYRLSFYARGKPGTRGSVTFLSFHWRNCGSSEFSLTDQWKRIIVRIPPYSNAHPSHRILFQPREAPFSVDRVQLEEGTSATEFVHPFPITLNATTGAPAEIVTTEELPVSLKGSVFLARPGSSQILLKLYWNKNLIETKAIPSDQALTSFTFSCPFAREAGYYPCRIEALTLKGEKLAQQSVPFLVTEPFPKGGDYYGIMSGPIELAALRRMGVSLLRNNIEIWKDREKNGPRMNSPEELSSGPVYGSDFRFLGTLYNLAEIPVWARRPNSRFADPEKFASYLERLLERNAKKVTALEMDNEIDLSFVRILGISRTEVVQRYGELLKKAHPIAKKYGVKLAVSPATGPEFTEQLFRSAHESFDIFAVHPYVYPRTISPLGYDCANPESGGFLSRMDHIVKLIRQYGNKHELGVGELGWNLTNDADYSSRAAAIQAAYLARSSILMRTYPECRWSIWYTISNNTGQSDYGIFRTDNGMRPLPAAAAFAQVAHLFQGMQGGQARRLLDDAPHYLVEWSLDGERRFALWTSDEEATPVFLSLPKMKVWNLYGSSLSHRKVPYTDMPVFLAVPEKEGNAAAESIKKELTRLRPFRLSASLISRKEVRLRVYSNSDRERKVTFSLENSSPGTLVLKPRQETVFSLQLSRPMPIGRSMDSSLRIFFDNESRSENLHFSKLNPVAFRDCHQDWKNWDFTKSPGVILLNRRSHIQPPDVIPWKGPQDLSAMLFFCYDQSAFYLFASVRDDKLEVRGNGKRIYQGDCLQFAIDPENDACSGKGFQNDYEFGSAFGKEPWCWFSPDGGNRPARYENLITRTEDRTLYRIRIPWKQLSPLRPVPGNVFGLSIVIPDCDGGNVQFRLEYGGGIAAGKNPALFRKMTLLPPVQGK